MKKEKSSTQRRKDAKTQFDAIELSVLWSRLISIVDEAGTTLQRTAFSSVTRESADFAVVLMDTKGQSLAQSSVSVPSFLGVLPFLVKALIKDYFPVNSWKEGDVVITNDPWLCAGHKPDIGIVTPIFKPNSSKGSGELIGFIGCIAHSPDIGGTLWGAGAKDFYEEGLYIPPAKLYDAGIKNEVLFRIIETNVRAANQTMGDILAQVAANDQGIRSLHRMMEENGLSEIDSLGHQIIASSEKAMRAAIKAAPNGVYKSDYHADGDGIKEAVKFVCTITIKDDEIYVDYTGTSAAHSLAINAVLNYVFAYTAYPIKCVFSPEVPNNEGSFRPIHVSAPEGSLLNAKKPSPLGARNVTGNLLHGPIMKALSQAIPDKVQADCGAAVWVMVLSGKKENGAEFVEYLFLAGGYGGRKGLDGDPTLCYPTNVANVPIEVFENDAPVLVTEKSLIPNSGGKGKWKGGAGQKFAYKNIGTLPIQISNVTEKINNRAYGLFGGEAGRKGAVYIRMSNGKKRFTPPKGHDKLHPGEELVMELPGGGGYGRER
ncbi:MAG: hydantoinase B/oxoprolinase family protein [Sediminibacterium sp.]|nr:hydantoinase B/oxoprolinase family protein [Sediminibacterium sp.]MBX9780365.1 hydantoinase B/oxoprolinase family protein [Chitinophagaceae bacterium]